jgi:hypothetical protein
MMAQPPGNVSPELNAKWLALRQRHQEDSNDFQHAVAKSKSDFDNRVELASKKLLEKHIREESEFWNNHARASVAAQTATLATNSARILTSGNARENTKASRASTLRAATLRMQHYPTTPSRVFQSAKSPQVSQTLTKTRPPLLQRTTIDEVIDLCDSDGDDISPVKKAPVVRKPVAQVLAHQQPVVQEPATPGHESFKQVQNSALSSIPEANIEFVGGNVINRAVSCGTNSQLNIC